MNFGDTAKPRPSSSRPLCRTTARSFFRTIPARFVLEPIQSARKYSSALVPDDLLVVEEADAEQAIEHFAREFALTRAKRTRPRGEGTSANASDQSARVSPEMVVFGAAPWALLHVRRLGRAMPIQPRTIPPLGIKFDAIGWICHHEPRLAFAEQTRHDLGTGRVSAEHAMLVSRISTQPQIAQP